MSLPFPTNALPQTVQDAGTSILICAVVLSFSIVVDAQGLILDFHKGVKKSSRCLGSFLLQEKRVLIPKWTVS